jgi:outer membrane protein OmpA-like peptidoglycan-associated protein/tetratricopeptide (TPR) repeat protein
MKSSSAMIFYLFSNMKNFLQIKNNPVIFPYKNKYYIHGDHSNRLGMKRAVIVLLFLSLIFNSFTSFSRKPVKISKRDFKVGESGFKTAWQHVKEGDLLFRKGPGGYPQALEHYLMAYQYNASDPALNYRIGVCYLNTDHKDKALFYLEAAYTADSILSQDILYLLGRAHQYRYEFEEALKYYRAFIQGPGYVPTVPLAAEARKHIEECQHAKEVVSDTVPAVITDMGSAINSPWDDYKAIVSPAGDRLFFTSRRRYSPKQLPNRYDGKYEEDIYLSEADGNGWTAALRAGKPLNTRYNNAALALMPDGSELFLYDGKKGKGDILSSRQAKGKWTKPKKITKKINSKGQETALWISPDSSTVYFVSDNQKLTTGGKDIFVVHRDAKGRWSDPQPLDTTINTKWDEESPWLTPDGRTLYFSSEGHNSMGGFDVFRSHLDDEGHWSVPENLGVPLNTPDDDLFYFPSPVDSMTAYISGIRSETHGLKDIYQVVWLPQRVPDSIVPEVLEVHDDVPIVPEGGTVNTRSLAAVPVFIPPRRELVITGRITDKNTGAPLLASIEIIDMDKNQVTGKALSRKSDGVYTIRRKKRKSFGVEINAPGYMFLLDMIDVPRSDTVTIVHRDFRMSPIKVGETVVLQNIFFETNLAVITPVSFPALDRVINFMKNNPGIRVEIDGHTDSVGSDAYNLKLSQARAQSVVEYLVKHGIPRERLVAKGFGETKPVAPNTTPEGRAKNRRVEFRILEM